MASFVYAVYKSDNGNSYVVKVSQQTASQGGFTGFTGNIGNALIWPYGAKNMRHVWGYNSTNGKRAKLPIADKSNSKFTSGGTFTTPNGTYVIEGSIGEARKLNHVA